MKKILLLSLIFKICVFSILFHLSQLKEWRKDSIINSLVIMGVKVNNIEVVGSGTLINIRKNNYVLTSAHVCLGSELANAIDDNIEDVDIDFIIDSKELYLSTQVNHAELIYNLGEDWCLIPVHANIRFPILESYQVSSLFTDTASTITYNRQRNTSVYDKFTACATKPFWSENFRTRACVKDPELKNGVHLSFTSSRNQSRMMYLEEHYTYQFPTIPGDSGSPVFNKNNMLVGLVAGTSMDNMGIVKFGYVTPMRKLKDFILKGKKPKESI